MQYNILAYSHGFVFGEQLYIDQVMKIIIKYKSDNN